MNTLSPLIRKKAEWISIVCGIVGGTLANIERSNAVVLCIVLASITAGAVGNISADAGDDPGLRPRAGIRSGVLTAVIAGAVAVLGFTIRSPFRGFAVVLPALLAIPPGAFFGMLGSLVVSMIQNPQVRPLGPSDARERSRPSVLLIAILISSIAGYLSPFIALLLPTLLPKPAPSPSRVVAATPTPTPAATPSPKPEQSPSPSWRYETPLLFADVHPSQLNVLKEVSLGPIERPFRFAFARDGHTFAFVGSNSAITVLDLNEPATTVSMSSPETPERFVFSPDGKRLFCISAKGGKFVVSKERAIRLPLPAGTLSGKIEWAENTRISVGDKVLDLDTLQLSPAPESRLSLLPASHSHIRLRAGRRITGFQDSRLETEPQHFFADAKRDYSVLTPATAEIAFLSADATKLFLVRDRDLTVVYFELRASRETHLIADMGTAPVVAIANAFKERNVIAVLCPPIINPLNNKPVGADLTRIKAVLGVESMEDHTVKLFVAEDYGMKAEPGDAVGFVLDTGRGRNAGVEALADWWALVREVTPGVAPDVIAQREPVPPKPAESPKISPPAPEPPLLTVSDSVAELLRSFVQAHHAKSSRGDVDGLVADYSERVDHLKGSVVDREAIRLEELKYHSPGTRVSEVVDGEIKLTAVGGTVFRANYTIRYEQVRPSGSWARGLSDIELLIDVPRDSPRPIPQIIRQRANNRDKQKGP